MCQKMGVPERREMKRHRRHNLKDRFEIIKTLGQGTYGKVKLAIEKSTLIQFAIKSIRKRKIESEQDLTRVRREIEIMATLYHPHIVTVHEVFENRDRIVLVMDYAAGGELYDYINERKGLYEEEARKFFRQMVSAIHYLHANGIVHRDLKLENILLDAYGNVKIADFGLSNVYGGSRLLNTFCGSPLYASPEIVNGQPYYGPEVDCWSLGVVLYTLVYGAMPFDGSDFKKLKQQITEGDYFEPKSPSDATGLIKQLLCPNPAKRATVDDICGHWWVNFGYEQTPSQITEACAGPVDRNSLVESLKSGYTSDSDTENPNPLLAGHKQQPSRPLKGILKKPRDKSSSQNKGEIQGKHTLQTPEFNGVCHKNRDRLKKPRSNCELNSDWLGNSILTDNHEYDKKLQNRRSAPVSCDIAKAVFDSTKKPKKSILKNRSGNSRSDSGCVVDEQMNIYTALENFEVVYPFPAGDSTSSSTRNTTHDSQRDSAYSDRKQSCDSNEMAKSNNSIYDLDDIESVLDEIVNFEVTTEMKLAHEINENNVGSSHNRFSESSNTARDYSDYDPLKEPVRYRHKTSTPNRPLKSILKRNSRSKENSWRYSLGSQGSNSSADILDFSYDSADGEYYMQEFCAVPIPLNDEEEKDIHVNNHVIDQNIPNLKEKAFKSVNEPWSEFDIMPWQEVDVPLNDSLLKKSPMENNEVETYDNVRESYDNVSESDITNEHNTHGEECAAIDLKLNDLNNSDFDLEREGILENVNVKVTHVSSSVSSSIHAPETPPPLPERPPPIGAPASPVRYRVTPPPTPPPPLPETPPPPFKAFELDIFEFDAFNLDGDFSKKEPSKCVNESFAADVSSHEIISLDYTEVFDAIEKQAKALSKSNGLNKEPTLVSKPSVYGLDRKLLAQMQGYFNNDEPVVDFGCNRTWSKSHSAQAISETENMYNKQQDIRPLSRELQDTLDFYNLELYSPFEYTKLHISEDDLMSIKSDNLKEESKSVGHLHETRMSSCSETDEDFISNVKDKVVLHIDSADTDTGNESLAPSSHEDLQKIDSELMELFIEEDTMQKNTTELARTNVPEEFVPSENFDNECDSIESSWENLANQSDAGPVEFGVKHHCVQLPYLLVNEQSSTSDISNICPESYSSNNAETASCDLYIDENNLLSAISNVSDSTLPKNLRDSKSRVTSSDSTCQHIVSSSTAHYLDDIMEKIDLLGEQLDCELMDNNLNTGGIASDISRENLLMDFEEASAVCQQALEICKKL